MYITANVKPDRELVASLVKAVHGQVCVLCCYLIIWPKFTHGRKKFSSQHTHTHKLYHYAEQHIQAKPVDPNQASFSLSNLMVIKKNDLRLYDNIRR